MDMTQDKLAGFSHEDTLGHRHYTSFAAKPWIETVTDASGDVIARYEVRLEGAERQAVKRRIFAAPDVTLQEVSGTSVRYEVQ